MKRTALGAALLLAVTIVLGACGRTDFVNPADMGGPPDQKTDTAAQPLLYGIPDPPSHIMQPGQSWPYTCGTYSYCFIDGVYQTGTYPSRCPCIVEPPPGCRMPAPGLRSNMPVSGESRICTGPTLSGNCIVVQNGTTLDYFWMALAGFESTWPDGSFTGIVSYELGPHTQLILTVWPDGFSGGGGGEVIYSNNSTGSLWVSPNTTVNGTTTYGTIREVYSHVMP